MTMARYRMYLGTDHLDACCGVFLPLQDWQIPLGRRFRSLKLWFVLRSYGAEALREHIRTVCGLVV